MFVDTEDFEMAATAAFQANLASMRISKASSSMQFVLPELTVEARATTALSAWTDDAQQRFRFQVGALIQRAFPQMMSDMQHTRVNEFFEILATPQTRQMLLVYTPDHALIAATLCDAGPVRYRKAVLTGVYVLSCSVHPDYQGHGLGTVMASAIFAGLRPDILLITCSQSASLHSWIHLPEKHLIAGYEVFPRLICEAGECSLYTFPLTELDFVIKIFTQMFARVVAGQEHVVQQALRNVTIYLVRKNMYQRLYDFEPWRRKGKIDALANMLGVSEHDGILAVFRRIV